MSNPRIEEVSDDSASNPPSDPEEMDLDAFDFARPAQNSLNPSAPTQQQQSTAPHPSQMSPEALQQYFTQQQQQQQQQQSAGSSGPNSAQKQAEHRERTKHWLCLYPIYFDAARSHSDGRRVSASEAVANPLAREIVDAVQWVAAEKGLTGAGAGAMQVAFEPAKSHPKDWANPGRVRVYVPAGGGRGVGGKGVGGRHHLYKLIAEYLRAHPTTPQTPARLRVQGLPAQEGPAPRPAVPRGWKMGTVLPTHSPALSGGGVSENMFQDMMAEMGQAGAGGGGAGGPQVEAAKGGKGRGGKKK